MHYVLLLSVSNGVYLRDYRQNFEFSSAVLG